MGPKMCALAGAEYDGAFFNWMTPPSPPAPASRVEAGARGAGRETPPVFGYVRTAVGTDAAAAPGQGGVLLPRPPRWLPQPLRPPRRARGYGRRRRRDRRRRRSLGSRAYMASTRRRQGPGERQSGGDDRSSPQRQPPRLSRAAGPRTTARASGRLARSAALRPPHPASRRCRARRARRRLE